MNEEIQKAVSECLKKFNIDKFILCAVSHSGVVHSCRTNVDSFSAIAMLEIQKSLYLNDFQPTQHQVGDFMKKLAEVVKK